MDTEPLPLSKHVLTGIVSTRTKIDEDREVCICMRLGMRKTR